MAVTRARCDPQTRDYIARKKAEAKTTPTRFAASNDTSRAAPGSSYAPALPTP
jgi:hypothetical protein